MYTSETLPKDLIHIMRILNQCFLIEIIHRFPILFKKLTYLRNRDRQYSYTPFTFQVLTVEAAPGLGLGAGTATHISRVVARRTSTWAISTGFLGLCWQEFQARRQSWKLNLSVPTRDALSLSQNKRVTSSTCESWPRLYYLLCH